MKICYICKQFKEISHFYKDKKQKDQLTKECKKCSAERSRIYRINNPDKMRETKLLYYYGITLKQYNNMLVSQDKCCKICNMKAVDSKKPLDVDHSHETGNIRGLLCTKCNKALGLFGDSFEILYRAYEYLKNDSSNMSKVG